MKRKQIIWIVTIVIVVIAIFAMYFMFNQSEDKGTQDNGTSSNTSSVKTSSQSQGSSVSSTSLSGDESLTLETSSETTNGTDDEQSTDDSQVVNVREARIKLYEAGIDSSSLDDATITQYWQAAKEQQTDFPTYVKNQLKQ